MLITLFACLPARAESPKPKTGGITISPASQEIILKQGQKLPAGSFTITNNNDRPETFELITVDMGALDDTGGLVFSGLPEDYQRKYGLAEWLELSQKTVAIQPRGKEVVSFVVKDEASLSPGGHYGAVVVRRVGAQTPVPDQRIALSPQAASLVFLRKVGGEIYGLSLPRITSNHSIWHRPTKASLPFKNDGNVHVVPRGVVRVKDMFGHEIAKGIINPESALVLPERSRTLSVPLNFQSKTIWPGRYTITVEYRYDGQDKLTTITQTFYTANLRILLLLIGSIVILLYAGYKVRKKIWKAVGGIRALMRNMRRLFKRRH